VNRPALLLLAALTLSGCKTTHTTTTIEKVEVPAAPAPVANAGSITGTIHFTGKPPARVDIDMHPAIVEIVSSPIATPETDAAPRAKAPV